MLLALSAALLAQNSVEFTGRPWKPQMATQLRVEANGFGAASTPAAISGWPTPTSPPAPFT